MSRRPFDITLEQRRYAVELFVQSHEPARICRQLRRERHPDYTVEQIHEVYFPNKGMYSLVKYRTASADKIWERWAKMEAYHAGVISRSAKLNQRLREDPALRQRQLNGVVEYRNDPVLAKARAVKAANTQAKRGVNVVRSQEMKARWQDPEFRQSQLAMLQSEERREQVRRLSSDPVIRQKRAEGLKKYWEHWWSLPSRARRKRRAELRRAARQPERICALRAGFKQYWVEKSARGEQPKSAEARRAGHEVYINGLRTLRLLRAAAQPPKVPRTRKRNPVPDGKKIYRDKIASLKQMSIRDDPALWFGGIVAPDYAGDVYMRIVEERLHSAVNALEPRMKAAVCSVFGLNLSSQEDLNIDEFYPGEIVNLIEDSLQILRRDQDLRRTVSIL